MQFSIESYWVACYTLKPATPVLTLLTLSCYAGLAVQRLTSCLPILMRVQSKGKQSALCSAGNASINLGNGQSWMADKRPSPRVGHPYNRNLVAPGDSHDGSSHLGGQVATPRWPTTNRLVNIVTSRYHWYKRLHIPQNGMINVIFCVFSLLKKVWIMWIYQPRKIQQLVFLYSVRSVDTNWQYCCYWVLDWILPNQPETHNSRGHKSC